MGSAFHYVGNGVLIPLVQRARCLPEGRPDVFELFSGLRFLLLGLTGDLLLGPFGEVAGFFFSLPSGLLGFGFRRFRFFLGVLVGMGAFAVCVAVLRGCHNSFNLGGGLARGK